MLNLKGNALGSLPVDPQPKICTKKILQGKIQKLNKS